MNVLGVLLLVMASGLAIWSAVARHDSRTAMFVKQRRRAVTQSASAAAASAWCLAIGVWLVVTR